MQIGRGQVQFAGIFLDARFGIEMRYLQPSSRQQLRMRQGAQDGVLHVTVTNRVHQIATLREFSSRHAPSSW